jgi:hypothetical protein
VSDVERTKHAKEVLQAKITKTMDNIKSEQAVKEGLIIVCLLFV